MRNSTAYFAGAGTVAIAVALGLGGGLMIARSISPNKPPLETTKLERQVSNAQPAPSAPVSSYLAATQAAAITPIVVTPSAKTLADQSQSVLQGQPSAQAAPRPAVNAPEDAMAKMDIKADVKQPDIRTDDADAKARPAERRRSAERHRSERRQQWAEQRRSQRRRDPDLREVEQAARDDSAPRTYAAQPPELAGPRFGLFGDD